MLSAAALKARARDLGFNLVGITPARPAPHLDAYLRWVQAGCHGEMGYLAREDRLARRRDLNLILPGVRSLVMVGLDYRSAPLPPSVLTDPRRGRIATYAWGMDYHDVMTPRLEALARELGAKSRVYVDTGALLERDHGWQAGLGFIGKNTMLIHPRRGSDFFLGVMLTTAEFDAYDRPGPATRCGTCTRCLVACPTNAFPESHVLDARRCISYLTIEHKGVIARELRPLLGNWVFGCDVCQDVCPWNRFAVQTQLTEFFPVNADRAAPPLAELLALDEAGFVARFAGSPIERIGRVRLMRNACVAAGNSGDATLISPLQSLLSNPHPLIRLHAAWALARLAGPEAGTPLRVALSVETDPAVRQELATCLDETSQGR
ncbi:MAG: tRNA epoxyqueuosine(34) reductase QueG [Anaerolineales bacterium]|nr:tRNA epoxyqueuosine(34) reductase QueG [Anaerolineales bacterium]